MEQILVTIIGIGDKHEGKYDVEIGDILSLEKEPDNEHDENAIKVLFDGKQVGYVGNGPVTVLDDCLSANKLQAFFNKEVNAKIIKKTNVRFSVSSGGYRESLAYIAQILPMEKKSATEGTNMNKEMKFKLVGQEVIYVNKSKLRQSLKDGRKPKVELALSGDKIVATFEDVLCGYIEKKKAKGFYSADELKSLIEDGSIATIIEQSGTNLIGSFTVTDKQLKKEKNVKDLKTTLQYLIGEGLDTEENLKEKIAFLKKNGITEKEMLNMFKTYEKYPDDVKSKIPPKPRTLYQDNHGLIKKSIAYMNANRNMMFEGDRGVGKNVLTETLAWLYSRPLYEFSMNSQHDNNSLLGGKTFTDNDKYNKEESKGFISFIMKMVKRIFKLKDKEVELEANDFDMFLNVSESIMSNFSGKKLVYEKSSIIEACEYGGIIVFDEFNTSLGHILSLFNSLLDDRRRITVPGYETIEAHPNFLAIATQNKDYQGTFENNEATVDRFVPIIFPTLDSIEDVLMAKVPSISYDDVKTCQALFKGIKKSVEDGVINERALTIRGFIDACLVIEHGLPLKEALIDNIANRASDVDDRKSIKNMIDIQVL